MDPASVSGIAGQILRGFFNGWLRNEARDPVLLVLFLASWWNSQQNFEKVFQKLDSLVEGLDQRGRTSEEGPACGGGACSRAEAAGATQGGGACGGSGAP